jgi:hypothetical protein
MTTTYATFALFDETRTVDLFDLVVVDEEARSPGPGDHVGAVG